jgi:hypothetical protein
MAVSLASGATTLPKEAPLWLIVTITILIVVLVVGAAIIMGVGRWAKASTPTSISAGDQLSQFRLMYEQGECTREEYERIRDRLGKRLRKEMDLPPKGDKPSPPAGAVDDRIQLGEGDRPPAPPFPETPG